MPSIEIFIHSSCNSWVLSLCLFGASVNAQTVSPGGVVNAAGYQAPVAPGSVISIFGSNLASAAKGASTVPLPANLGGVSVSVNGTLAPLFYVSPSQINAQLPFETATGQATLSVNGQPRLLRLFAETRDRSGKLHGALIDVSPLSVVVP